MEIVVKRKFLKMKQGWRQALEQFEAGPAASAIELEKMVEIRGAFFGPKKVRKGRPITWASPVLLFEGDSAVIGMWIEEWLLWT